MGNAPETAQVETRCPWCGEVRLPVDDMRCAVGPARPDDGLCEFDCPTCGRLLLRRVRGDQGGLLLEAGAARLSGSVPFELLEARDGAALTWDDLLDLHLELEATSYPQAELAG